MKKIIAGKLYDTEKAECIAGEDISLHNFYSTRESLYRTTKGTWLLHGESSAGGKYSKWTENSCGCGEGLKLMSKEEVLEWAENAQITDEEKAKIAELLAIEEG